MAIYDRDLMNGEVPKKTGSALTFRGYTFGRDASFQLEEPVGAASISPSGRDVALGSREGLHIVDLDDPYTPPRLLKYQIARDVVDIQWSPFASRDSWIVSTAASSALVWDVEKSTPNRPVITQLNGHGKAITDINFAAHDPDLLATCGVDSFVFLWDIRTPKQWVSKFADWHASASQVKWNRQDGNILASSHDRRFHVWDVRKAVTPLRTIDAHTTKIYGLDWNRDHRDSILTCSLDKTIKFWNWSRDSEPDCGATANPCDRTLHVPYPVGRARHTPFGYGILAMPKRGDLHLHLYDRRNQEADASSPTVPPVHSFGGHSAPVKEFLWRYQGGISDGLDMRDFQLVSWGSDKRLCLHKMTEESLAKVSYQKEGTFEGNIRFTRANATYKTFRKPEEPLEEIPALIDRPVPEYYYPQLQGNHLDFGSREHQGPQRASWWGNKSTETITSPVASKRKARDPMAWMRRVQIGRTDEEHTRDVEGKKGSAWLDMEWFGEGSYGEEIKYVSEKFSDVDFEEVDLQRGRLKFALSGPWGEDMSPARLVISIKLSRSYPQASPPEVFIDRILSSALPSAKFEWLSHCLSEIGSYYVGLKRGCLEVMVSFLRGLQSFEACIPRRPSGGESRKQSMAFLGNMSTVTLPSTEDDEDDDDAVIGTFQKGESVDDLENSATDLSELKANVNVNVPLPRSSGARWAPNGQLICFFPAKPKVDDIQLNPDGTDLKPGWITSMYLERIGAPGPQTVTSRPSSSSSEVSSDSDDPFSASPVPYLGLSSYRFTDFTSTTDSWINTSDSAGSEKDDDEDLPLSRVTVTDLESIIGHDNELASKYRLDMRPRKCCVANLKVCESLFKSTGKVHYQRLTRLWRDVGYICGSAIHGPGRTHPFGVQEMSNLLNRQEVREDIHTAVTVSTMFALQLQVGRTRQSEQQLQLGGTEPAASLQYKVDKDLYGCKNGKMSKLLTSSLLAANWMRKRRAMKPARPWKSLNESKDPYIQKPLVHRVESVNEYWLIRYQYAEQLSAWGWHEQRRILEKVNLRILEDQHRTKEPGHTQPYQLGQLNGPTDSQEEVYSFSLSSERDYKLSVELLERTPPRCGFCDEATRGQALLCTFCGHSVHPRCWEQWTAGRADTQEALEEGKDPEQQRPTMDDAGLLCLAEDCMCECGVPHSTGFLEDVSDVTV
ncbi:MAG: hypothetical protein M1831_004574 [Alyxoria varia]|nr:MAG: hypothetical protein M1831_004574 [Alyxoria varia]